MQILMSRLRKILDSLKKFVGLLMLIIGQKWEKALNVVRRFCFLWDLNLLERFCWPEG